MSSTYRALAIKKCPGPNPGPHEWMIIEERGEERIVLHERFATYPEAEARVKELSQQAR